MPALMAQRSSSAMLSKIRHELERRRKAINVAKGGVAKKSSAARPRSRPITSVSGAGAATLKKLSAPPPPHPRVLIPVATPSAATSKIAYLEMEEPPKRCTAPPRRSAMIAHEALATKLSTASSHETTGPETEYIKKPSSLPIKKPSSAPIQKRPSSISVKKGMTVKVRAPARTLPTGQRIVILHPAVVVSDVEDGYLQVVYSGYPRDRTVRVALNQVKKKKNMPTGPQVINCRLPGSQPTTAESHGSKAYLYHPNVTLLDHVVQ